MAEKKKIRPGRGAIAEVSSIKLYQEPLPDGSKDHCSMIFLEDEGEDVKKQEIIPLYYDDDGSGSNTLTWVNHRLPSSLFFESDDVLQIERPDEPPESDEQNILHSTECNTTTNGLPKAEGTIYLLDGWLLAFLVIDSRNKVCENESLRDFMRIGAVTTNHLT